MRELTLAKKLLWITVGSTFLTVLVLSGVLWWQMSSNSEALAKESEDYIVAEVEQKLSANAAAYGEKIAGFINEAYRIPNSLAALLGDAANTQTLDRDTVVSINRSILEKKSVFIFEYKPKALGLTKIQTFLENSIFVFIKGNL